MKERIFKIICNVAVTCISAKKLRKLQYWVFRSREVLKEAGSMNNALIVYYSLTGNTEKVAHAIQKGLEKAGRHVTVKKIDDAENEDLYMYDLVCFGTPVIHSLPANPVLEFIKKNDKRYRDAREVPLSPPELLNKNALVFCTYSGAHCGIDEALPAGKYLVQFLKHLGFSIKGEWYEIGEFHEWPDGSIKGRLGDIRGRPNDEDLALIELKTIQLARSL